MIDILYRWIKTSEQRWGRQTFFALEFFCVNPEKFAGKLKKLVEREEFRNFPKGYFCFVFAEKSTFFTKNMDFFHSFFRNCLVIHREILYN